MRKTKRLLAVILSFCMICGMSTAAFANEPEVVAGTEIVQETEAPETESEATTEDGSEENLPVENTNTISLENQEATPVVAAESFDEFLRIYHLDCGRIYFSPQDIKDIIDLLSKYDYTHMELAFGNGGLRFLLDDMSVSDGTKTYDSNAVKTAVKNGNASFVANDGQGGSSAPNTCLTQAEMDSIIAYAAKKGIKIIPLFNSPGHMNAVVSTMAELGIQNAAFTNNGITAKSTADLTNTKAVTFTQNLIQKYITYFAGKGCTMFNLGADEYANDPSDASNGTKPLSGFGAMNNTTKANFIKYVNEIASKIKTAGMTPLMFNDGFAWSDAAYNKDIVYCCWENAGIGAGAIASKGYKVINTNKAWYYVMGSPFGTGSGQWCSLAWAQNGTANTRLTTMVDGSNPGNLLKGAMMCTWVDFTSKAYTDAEKTNVAGLIQTLAESNPTYFTNVKTEETITVTEGRSKTITIPGTYTGQLLNDETATVSGTATEGSDYYKVNITDSVENGQYLIANSKYTRLMSASATTGKDYTWNGNEISGDYAADLYTFTKQTDGTYTVQNSSGQYISINGQTLSLTSNKTTVNVEIIDGKVAIYTVSGGQKYCLDDYNNTSKQIAAWNNNPPQGQNQWYLCSNKKTELTFTGNAVGTTQVTIGNTIYTINVVEEDLSAVTLTYHPWISSFAVFPEGTTSGMTGEGKARNVEINATIPGMKSESGVAWSSVAPETGNWQWEGEAQTYYWKGVLLAEGNHQKDEIHTDQSMNGTDFAFIRYWNGVWSVSADQKTWIEIKDTDEVCAYYLQKTGVTKEVDTYVKDWALTPHNSASTSNDSYQKALSFAVVYPDGQMKTEDEIYTDSTLIYYNNLDPLTFVRFAISSTYEVEKITWTLGARDKAAGSADNKWSINDRITWNKVRINGTTNQKWYDETTCWTPESGTEPVVNGQDLHEQIYAGTDSGSGYDGTWGRDDAVLLLVYLKPVVTSDSLMVRYWDDSTGSEILNYPVNITNESTAEAGTFVNRLAGNAATPVAGQDIVLDDAAYVVNANGVQETFEKNLSNIPSLHGKYASGLYSYMKADISADGKTLNLHYNLDSTKLTKSYVVDFGQSVEIPLSDLVEYPNQVKGVSANSIFGTAEYVATEKKIVYTPNKVLTRTEMLNTTITFAGENQNMTIAIYPATTVFYEENFLTKDASWSTVGNNTAKQATEALGSKANNYGYDSSYATANDGSYIESTALGATASFAFTGTGVNLYTNNTTGTGRMTVTVKDANTNKLKKLYSVNTVMANGSSEATANQTINDKSFPSVSLLGMAHGNYNVTIKSFKLNTEAEANPIRIDGFRVYDTIAGSQAATIYAQDGEAAPSYYNLRNSLLTAYGVTEVAADQSIYVGENGGTKYYVDQVYDKAEGTANVVAYISGQSKAQTNIADYLDNGPKNQIYIQPGDAVTFNVPACADAQLGLKAIGGTVNASINNTPVAVNANTDMFYSVAEGTQVTVTNPTGSGATLAVTDLKVIGASATAAMEPLTNDQIATAAYGLMCMSLMPEEPSVPVAPVEPATKDATLTIVVKTMFGKEIARDVLVYNGAEGEAHTFSKTDVKAVVNTLTKENGYQPSWLNNYKAVNVTCGDSKEVTYKASFISSLFR